MFRPSLLQLSLTLFGITLFSALSMWQWSRATEKFDMLAELAQHADAVPWTIDTPYRRMVTVTGEYDPRVVLLDNQLKFNQRGFSVWSVLRTADSALLVERGWLAADIDRRSGRLVVPNNDISAWQAPSGPQTIQGFWMSLPRAAFINNEGSRFTPGEPLILQYPNVETLQAVYGLQVYNGRIVEKLPESTNSPHESVTRLAANGLVQDTTPESLLNFGPERHIGYAITWACFVLASLVLFAVFARLRAKRLRPDYSSH